MSIPIFFLSADNPLAPFALTVFVATADEFESIRTEALGHSRRLVEADHRGTRRKRNVSRRGGLQPTLLHVLGMMASYDGTSDGLTVNLFNDPAAKLPARLDVSAEGAVCEVIRTSAGPLTVGVEAMYHTVRATPMLIHFIAHRAQPWDGSEWERLGVRPLPSAKPQAVAPAPAPEARASNLADRMRARREPA